MQYDPKTASYSGGNKRYWRFYTCARCGGVVTAAATGPDEEVIEMYPQPTEVSEAVPERARNYLNQAINSLSSPAGALMLAASSVDAMLKAKGLRDGSLYARIDEAAK